MKYTIIDENGQCVGYIVLDGILPICPHCNPPDDTAKPAPPSPRIEDLPDDPYQAWPLLLEIKPWIFDGINISKEPYAHFLKGRPSIVSRLARDVAAVAHLVNPKLADIAEALTGKRQYGGSVYERVKAVANKLKTTTTTAEPPGQAEKEPEQAA